MPTIITVGDVYRFFARQSNPPKKKRVILVAHVDTNFLGIFINSQPNENIHTPEAIKDFHPKLEADGRKYLDHDSYADCCYPYEYSVDDIRTVMQKDLDAYLGSASLADIAILKKKLIDSPTVERWIKIKYFGDASVRPRRPRISMPVRKDEEPK